MFSSKSFLLNSSLLTTAAVAIIVSNLILIKPAKAQDLNNWEIYRSGLALNSDTSVEFEGNSYKCPPPITLPSERSANYFGFVGTVNVVENGQTTQYGPINSHGFSGASFCSEPLSLNPSIAKIESNIQIMSAGGSTAPLIAKIVKKYISPTTGEPDVGEETWKISGFIKQKVQPDGLCTRTYYKEKTFVSPGFREDSDTKTEEGVACGTPSDFIEQLWQAGPTSRYIMQPDYQDRKPDVTAKAQCITSSDPKIQSLRGVLDTLQSKRAVAQGVNNDLQTYLDKLIRIQNQTKDAHDELMNNYHGVKEPLENVQEVADSLGDVAGIYGEYQEYVTAIKLARTALQSGKLRQLVREGLRSDVARSKEFDNYARGQIEGKIFNPGELIKSALDISNYLTKLITNSELTPLEEGAESLKRASDRLTNYGLKTNKSIQAGRKLAADNQKTIAGYDLAISIIENRIQVEDPDRCAKPGI